RIGTSTTRAFSPLASSIDPSVLPLSATSTSPLILYCSRNLCALAIQLPKVRASLRQGRRIDSSGVITRDEKGRISKNFHRLPDIRYCALNSGLNWLCSSRARSFPFAFPRLSKLFLRQPVLPPSHYGYRQCTGPNRPTPGSSRKNDWSRSGQHRKSRLSIVTIPPISYRQTPSVPGLALLAERTDRNNLQLPRVARATSSARNWAIRVRHRHSVCKPHPEPEFLSR